MTSVRCAGRLYLLVRFGFLRASIYSLSFELAEVAIQGRGDLLPFSWPAIAVLLIGKAGLEKAPFQTGIGSDKPPRLYSSKYLVLIIIIAHVLHKDVKSRCDSPMISNHWPMLLPFLRPPLARVILGPSAPPLSHHMESGDSQMCCGRRTKNPPFRDEEPTSSTSMGPN